MPKSIIIFDEPELEFRFGQRVQDPRDGLSLFGPFDIDQPSYPGALTHVVLGTHEGIALFNDWSKGMNRPALAAPKGNHRLWPPFPGFEAAFCSNWSQMPVWSFPIDADELSQASRHRDPHERAFGVAQYYLEGLRRAHQLDDKIGVAVCVVPDEVWLNCRPQSRVGDAVGPSVSRHELNARKAGQLDLFESYDPTQYLYSTDFRSHLKARSMEYGIPLQIIRESTLRLSDDASWGKRALTPLSDRMWNLGTALYYKCGGKPWRLVTAREGVCYIGLAFRRTDISDQGTTACCAAQMFLNTGDGVIFLGNYGPWYSPKTNQFHLSKSAARDLLKGVLKTYEDMGGKDLKEIFLHSRSTISREEFDGYSQGCPLGVKLVGVRVRADFYGPRFFRTGQMPVIRGSFLRLDDRAGYLWGSGFKARLATYDGWEIPVPLRIDVQYGDSAVERVAQDIFGLTKLNYNACRLGDAQPVTVRFSNSVGEILISNPTVQHRKPNFKFYI